MVASSPFGKRNEKPVYFDLPNNTEAERNTWAETLKTIPGVDVRGDRAECTWEAAPTVASYLRVPTKLPDIHAMHIPGAERAKALGLGEVRDYQKKGARFAAVRPGSYIAHGCRTGKCVTLLTAAELAEAKRIFIAAPAIAKHGWNQDAWRWLKREAFIFRGKTGQRARVWCRTCNRTGVLGDGSACPDCKTDNGSSYGWRLYKVRQLGVWKGDSRGLPCCRIHRDVVGDPGQDCYKCLQEFIASFRKASVVISSYDILPEHAGRSRRGTAERRSDLPGVANRIETGDFDCAFLDELHTRRGTAAKSLQAKKGNEVNLRLKHAISRIPKVIGASATPIFSHVSDLYQQLDLINPGGFGYSRYKFDERYCAGYRSAYGGWNNRGSSIFSETELPQRLGHLMQKGTRFELLGPEAPITRSVISIEAPSSKKMTKVKMGVGVPLRALLAATLELKVDAIVESVLQDVAEGTKSAIFTLTRQNTETMAAAVQKALDSREYKHCAERTNARVYVGDGRIDGEVRGVMAEQFVASEGASIWISTISAAQMGISLAGVETIHMADITDKPAEMLQVEQRPNIVGRTAGLAVLFYTVEGSIDESIAENLVLNLPYLEKTLHDGDAKTLREALAGAEKSIDEKHAEWMKKLAFADLDDFDDD